MHRLTGRRPRAGRPIGAAAPDDRGAVAVLVAILVSALLFSVGALAVDLGSAWTARLGLRTAAEAAALAGAALLPVDPTDPAASTDEANAVRAAVDTLCGPGNARPEWTASGACAGGLPGWAVDGNRGNGEVSVVDSQEYSGSPVAPPRVLEVVTPPVRVQFGLARASGSDHVDVSASASARRGLAYPADNPVRTAPFYLTLDDVRSPASQGICLRVTPRPTTTSLTTPPDFTPDPASADPTAPDPWLRLGTLDGDDPAVQESPAGRFTVTTQGPVGFRLHGATFGPVTGVVAPGRVTVYLGRLDPAHAATTTEVNVEDAALGTYEIRFTTPDFTPTPMYGGPVPVWFVYDDGVTDFDPLLPGVQPGTSEASWQDNTAPGTVHYPPVPALPQDDCDPVAEGRGLVDLRRSDGTRGTGAATVADAERGLDTRLQVFGGWPRAQAAPATDVDCYGGSVTGVVVPAAPVPPGPGPWLPDANCAPLKPGSAVSTADLTLAWFGAGPVVGRLHTICSPETGTISGLPGTFDATNLFRRSNGLVTASVSTSALRDRIRAGRAADATLRGTIVEKVFDCPRLLLVPVVDTSRPPADPQGAYAVVGLTYFWVSDVSRSGIPRARRGIVRDSTGQVVGIRGWVVDPGYVRGGDWVDHLGDPDTALPVGVPKRAVLVRSACDDHPDSGCP
jgi:hypothetical protein